MRLLNPRASRLLLCALLFGGLPAFAQQSSGMISGVVHDAQGAVVPNAKVELKNQEQGAIVRELASSADGTFSITPLLPATYTITVEASGFKKYSRTDIKLFAQDRIGLPPIILEVGSVGESVTVEASAVTLQTVSGERSGVLSGAQVVDLASSTRVFTDLLKTVPGFNTDTQNANGMRVDQNALMVDGISSMDTGNNGTTLMRLNSDIIAEFKVLTKRPAGRVRPRRWRQHHHRHQGRHARVSRRRLPVFEKRVDERQLVDQQLQRLGPRPRPANRTQGFNLGGPVYIPGKFNSSRDKLFFFTNWEWQRPRLFDNLVSMTMPTADERAGDFSKTQENGRAVTVKDPTTGSPFPGNLVPKDRINKYGLELLNVMPLPNRLGVDPGYNYQYQFAGADSRDDRTFRVDWNISANWKFYFRLIQNSRDLRQQAGLNVNNVIGISPFHALTGAIAGSGNLTTIITPTLTNEFSYGNTRNWLPNVIESDSKYLRSNSGVTLPLLYPSADALGQIPNMTWDVTNSPNIYIAGMPYDNENPSINWNDNVAKVTSKHTMKFGIFIDTSRKRQTATIVNNGRIDFSRDTSNPGDTGWAFSNALLGNYKTFDQSNTYRKGYYHYKSYEWYAQDNWHIRQNLSLDFGIRFSLMPPLVRRRKPDLQLPPVQFRLQAEGHALSADAGRRRARGPEPAHRRYGPGGAHRRHRAQLRQRLQRHRRSRQKRRRARPDRQPRRGLWPRFGLAWTPSRLGTSTVIRLGGGVFYERIQGNMIFNQINYPPGLLTPKLYYGNLNGIASSAGTLFPLSVAGLSPEGKLPTVYNYNISIQRELPLKFLLDVGYVGTLTRHGLARAPFNESPFGSAWLPQNQDPTKAYNLQRRQRPAGGLPAPLHRLCRRRRLGGTVRSRRRRLHRHLRQQLELQRPAGLGQPPHGPQPDARHRLRLVKGPGYRHRLPVRRQPGESPQGRLWPAQLRPHSIPGCELRLQRARRGTQRRLPRQPRSPRVPQ